MSEASQQLPRAWQPGELLKVRGDRWRVESGEPFPGCELVRLAGVGRFNRGRHLAVLSPFDRPQPLVAAARLRAAQTRGGVGLLRSLLAGTAPFGRLRTVAGARLALHAWQLEPALAVVNGRATRLLLADAVGLGKTIQAGILLSELLARGRLARALILTPAGLRDQWAAELHERFSIASVIVDATFIRRAVADLAAGTNPWSVVPVIVASLDYVKRPEVLRALAALTWDALVVDEAHQCASAPERSAAVRALASRARHVALLTATPHAGDQAAFAALCAIGRLEGEDPIAMFRRSRRDVGLACDRRVGLLRVRGTADERAMHRQLDRYTRAVWTRAGATREARLAMVVLCKRAFSSAASLARTVERRLAALFDAEAPDTQMRLPFPGEADADEQTTEDDEPAGALAAPGLDRPRERAWLQRLLDIARRASMWESKIARLQQLLDRAGEPAIVFTEYRDTARRLAEALADHGPLAVLHGGLSRAERQDAQRRFRSGDATLLIATDAAGEGLNLHHRCRLVINLELPWNPMRLEQRIGRVDRLGQTRRVHAIHLVADATAEERVVRRLIVRQERARRAIGEVAGAIGAVREEEVAEAVMEEHRTEVLCRDAAARLTPCPAEETPDSAARLEPGCDDQSPSGRARLQPCHDGEEAPFRIVSLAGIAAEEMQRLQEIRRLMAPRTTPRSRTASTAPPHQIAAQGFSPVLSSPLLVFLKPRHPRVLPRGLVCLFLLRILDGHGRVVDESILALHVDLAGAGCWPARHVIELVAFSAAVTQCARAHTADRFEAVRPLHEQAVAAARIRQRAMADALRSPAAWFQPGMFDRRAARNAEREEDRRTALSDEQDRAPSALDAGAGELSAADPRLVLVLVVP